jgi:PST family polysaccharide transporter
MADEPHRAHDSLVSGLSWMLVINLLQRGIGFVRNIALCHFLSESQLGLWGLASSFFFIAAPLAVLGLPGTFGRFVEAYRSRGQLAQFLVLSMVIAMAGYFAIGCSLVLFRSASSAAIFGAVLSGRDMLLVATALGCIILFNATTELVSGLRMPKTVSWMHAVNSLSFTCLSLSGLYWLQDWRILVLAFAGSALLGIYPSLRVLLQADHWRGGEPQPMRWREMLHRVLPFAASVWMMNFLWNSFDLVDRYTLLHFASIESHGQDVHALLGQLHSGKLIPVLLANLAAMLAGIVLPYLVADWEQARQDRVAASLKTTVKFGSLFFFALSIGAMIASPFLFGWVLQGRYADGLAIMPKALTVCCWMSIALFLSNYFWCAERGRLLGLLTAVALVTDILLCIWWIPPMALHGALNANVVACSVLLVLMILTLRQFRVELDGATCLIAAAPSALVLGTLPAALVFAAILIAASRTTWLLTDGEKRGVDTALIPHLHRLGWRVASIWAR